MNKEQLLAMYKAAYGHAAPEGLEEKQLVQLLAPLLGIKGEGEGEEKSFTMTEKQLADAMANTIGKELKEVKDEMAEMQKEFQRKALAQKMSDGKDASPETKAQVGQMFKALVKGDMAKVKELTEGTDSEGGYLVHDEFIRQVIYVAETYGVARKYCLNVPMKGKTKNVSTLASSVTAYWTDEGAQITASDPAFGKKTLTAKKLAGITLGTNELIEDAEDADVFDLVAKLFAEEFAGQEDNQLFNGTGTVFTGILGDTNVNITVMKTGDTSFANITVDYLLDLIDSVADKYLKGKPRFYLNKNTLTHIRKLKDSQGQYIWQPAVAGGNPATILGYEYETHDKLPATADDAVSTKFVAFGDLRYVAFGDRKKTSAKILTEGTVAGINLGEKDEQALRLTERVGIVILIPEAFAVLKTAAS